MTQARTGTQPPPMRPQRRAAVDIKLEIVVIPVSDVDRAKAFYAKPRLAAGCRLRRRRLARDPVHAAGLAGLRHLRQERHVGGARLRAGTLSDRFRHRGRPQGSARSRRQGQRSLPRRRRGACRHGRALSVRHASAVNGARSRARQLPLLRLVQRSRRQWLAVPGDHHAVARTRRRATRASARRPILPRHCAAPPSPMASTRSATAASTT